MHASKFIQGKQIIEMMISLVIFFTKSVFNIQYDATINLQHFNS